ncbi:unnamed protein product [Closterium sp. Yama58-4]|nr:unnamed protein product [Closterium sp. Yama58-4]
MVFYFKVRPEAGDFTIYMGLDKYENEQLIKYGFPEDIWFHVDKLSSAHVYLRLRKGQGIDDVTPEMLEDCAQLVKANSIMGNKQNNIDVVYTPWANLRKAASMDVGQVGFHNPKAVRSVRVEKRLNEVVNRLNKTKVERTPDLQAEKEAREAEDRAARKAVLREQARREQEEKALKQKQAELRSYKCLDGCGGQSTSPNGKPGIDATVSTIAHEVAEAATDPDAEYGWFDAAGEENADKCSYEVGATKKGRDNRGNTYEYNLVGMNGMRFLIQQNWDRLKNKCVSQRR